MYARSRLRRCYTRSIKSSTSPADAAATNSSTDAAPPAKLDVVFVVDATGSMQDEIDDVKGSLVAIGDGLALVKPAPDARFGAVFYRDRGDREVVPWGRIERLKTCSTSTTEVKSKQRGKKHRHSTM